MRKNALRKNYDYRKSHNIKKEDENFIKHRVYKSRLTWQKIVYSSLKAIPTKPYSSIPRELKGVNSNINYAMEIDKEVTKYTTTVTKKREFFQAN